MKSQTMQDIVERLEAHGASAAQELLGSQWGFLIPGEYAILCAAIADAAIAEYAIADAEAIAEQQT